MITYFDAHSTSDHTFLLHTNSANCASGADTSSQNLCGDQQIMHTCCGDIKQGYQQLCGASQSVIRTSIVPACGLQSAQSGPDSRTARALSWARPGHTAIAEKCPKVVLRHVPTNASVRPPDLRYVCPNRGNAGGIPRALIALRPPLPS